MDREYGSIVDFMACCLLGIALLSSKQIKRVLLFSIAMGLLVCFGYLGWSILAAAFMQSLAAINQTIGGVLFCAVVLLATAAWEWYREKRSGFVQTVLQFVGAGVFVAVGVWSLVFLYEAFIGVPRSTCRDAAKTAIPTFAMLPMPLPIGWDAKRSQASTQGSPQLDMYFVNPANAEWRIKNHGSAGFVPNVEYWFALVDIDQHLLANNPPGYPGPFRMSIQKIDFINANDTAGGAILPLDLQPGIKRGDRVFGTATFGCPGCKEKAYWLYFKQGIDGWFSEMRGHTTRGLNFPSGAIVTNPDKELEKLVPSRTRVAIKNEKQ